MSWFMLPLRFGTKAVLHRPMTEDGDRVRDIRILRDREREAAYRARGRRGASSRGRTLQDDRTLREQDPRPRVRRASPAPARSRTPPTTSFSFGSVAGQLRASGGRSARQRSRSPGSVVVGGKGGAGGRVRRGDRMDDFRDDGRDVAVGRRGSSRARPIGGRIITSGVVAASKGQGRSSRSRTFQ